MCKQFYLFAAKVVTDPLFEFLRRKPPSRLDNGTFAMDQTPGSIRFIKATLDGKPARDDAHPRFAGSSLLKDVLVVLP